MTCFEYYKLILILAIAIDGCSDMFSPRNFLKEKSNILSQICKPTCITIFHYQQKIKEFMKINFITFSSTSSFILSKPRFGASNCTWPYCTRFVISTQNFWHATENFQFINFEDHYFFDVHIICRKNKMLLFCIKVKSFDTWTSFC